MQKAVKVAYYLKKMLIIYITLKLCSYCLVFIKIMQKKTYSKKSRFVHLSEMSYFYFTLFTIALKASGWFIAKSAKTLRLSSMLLAFTLPIN